jgi:hypothetical protein
MFHRRPGAGYYSFSLRTVRALSALSLLSYPVGALVLTLGPGTAATNIAGYALVLTSALLCAVLTSSTVQRVASGSVTNLSHAELQLRERAQARAYKVFCGLSSLAVLYAGLASDMGGWVPTTFEEFNGLFFGIFLYNLILPTAMLSWTIDSALSIADPVSDKAS